jgi:hypothetical protein
MRSKKILVKLGLMLFLFGNLLLLPSLSLAVENVNETKFTPQVSIPDSEFKQGTAVDVGRASGTKITSDLIGRYVVAFYNWGLSIGGVLAVLMLMAGGLIWLTSAGDSGKIDEAKKMISGSLLGTLLLVGAYFFLHTINPNLINMPAITMDTINYRPVGNGCCTMVKNSTKSDMTVATNCEKGHFFENKILNYTTGKCEEPVCCIKEQAVKSSGPTSIYCLDILLSECNQQKAKDSYTFKYSYAKTACSKQTKCTTPTKDIKITSNALCVGKKNGDKVAGGHYCYGEKIYIGDGKTGEPCGKQIFSKCHKEVGDEDCEQGTGGRNCITGLWCCQFDSSGKMIDD